MENQMDALGGKMDALEGKVDALDGKMASVEERVDTGHRKVDLVEGKVDSLIQLVEGQIAQTGQLKSQNNETATTSTATTTDTVDTTTPTPTEGILIAGGYRWDPLRSTEVFIPDTGKTCSLPDLPKENYGHTLDTLGNTPVICGGYGDGGANLYSCLQLTATSAGGIWTNYATTRWGRHEHSSWVSSAGLVLMGGEYSGTTTEIVPSGGANFTLVQNTKSACAIADKDSTIITGGTYTLKVVARYNLQGHVENLPEMTQERQSHGCGSYYSGGTMVLFVAGGYDASYNHIKSTEKMTAGATAWTTTNPLPRRLSMVATVSMDNSILIGGDTGGSWRREILTFDGEDWKKVGQLQEARYYTAATKIDMTHLMDFCN